MSLSCFHDRMEKPTSKPWSSHLQGSVKKEVTYEISDVPRQLVLHNIVFPPLQMNSVSPKADMNAALLEQCNVQMA